MSIPAFNIDAGTEGIGSTAPTRPPSRRSNYSTRSGAQQETGTINSLGRDTSGSAYFGPLTQDASKYVPEQWAMVPVSTSASRVYENADPDERRRDRENDEPVCFKPMRERDPLPSLMAILGQIPKARRKLLAEHMQMEHGGVPRKR